MYRPEGWETTKRMALPIDEVSRSVAWANGYEAGADAFLEAIWKMAKESPTGTFTFDTHEVPSVFNIKEE